jgi:hypothetical protein
LLLAGVLVVERQMDLVVAVGLVVFVLELAFR